MYAARSIRFSYLILPLLAAALACNLGAPLPQTATPSPVVLPTVEAPPVSTPTFEGAVPVELPAKRADRAGDVDSSANAHRQLVSGGDVFVHGLYERPFNSDPMDKYFAYLDIVDTQGFLDDTWGYASITLQNTDESGALAGQYAIELDVDRNGRGDWLIRVSQPSSTAWSPHGVQAWSNSDGDIGGVAIMTADSKPRGGNGYERLVFDEGKGDLKDGAWARVSPDDPKIVELAFKLEMIGNATAFAMGAWAGSEIDPAMFDYHDHMTHAQAGSPNPGYEVYPLKDMAEIDNTCRLAVGFVATGKEPGLCQTVAQEQAEAGGSACVPRGCSPNSLLCVPVTCP